MLSVVKICRCYLVSYRIKMTQTVPTTTISREEAWPSLHLCTARTNSSSPNSTRSKMDCSQSTIQVNKMAEALPWARVRVDLWVCAERSKCTTTKESMTSMLYQKLASLKTWSSSKETQIQPRKTIWNEKSSIFCLKLQPNFQQIQSIQS